MALIKASLARERGAGAAPPVSMGRGEGAHRGGGLSLPRFGASLNAHYHFHACVIEGLYEAAGEGVRFHGAEGLSEAAILQVQEQVRHRVLKAFVRWGLLEADAHDEMLGWRHGGVDGVQAAGGTAHASPRSDTCWNAYMPKDMLRAIKNGSILWVSVANEVFYRADLAGSAKAMNKAWAYVEQRLPEEN